MRTLTFTAIMAMAGAGLADALPFWGEGSPATNRVGAVSHVASLTNFSSMEWFSSVFTLQEFNSSRLGLVTVIR